jgi:uncharacterized protein (DUF1697 family)
MIGYVSTYVALLRGINVGGKAIVPMAELRSLLSSLGHADVVTYIQSGNAVFGSRRTADEVAAELEERIEQVFGVRTPVLLRTPPELAGVVARNPFLEPGADLSKLHVVFLESAPEPAAVAGLEPDRSPPDELAVLGREVYLRLPSGAGRTKLTLDWLERRLGTRGTARNWRTVTKLVEIARGERPS